MSKLFQHETDHLNGIIIADRTIEAMKNNTGDIYPYFEGKELDNFTGDKKALMEANFDKFRLLAEELFMASQCPLLERTNIVPFRNKFQFVCNSPGFNSTCNNHSFTMVEENFEI